MRPTEAVFVTILVASFAPLACNAEPSHLAVGEPYAFHNIASTTIQEPKPDGAKPEAKPSKAGKEKQKDEKTQTKPELQTKAERKDPAPGKHNDDKGGGRRIPDNDFKAHFGGSHRFKAQRAITSTTVVVNQTRFSYSGYTFVFLDPWPAGWLLTDDCYIDYVDGGYFLLDPAHPGIQVSLNVVL